MRILGNLVWIICGGLGSLLLNIVWIVLFGWELALSNLILGAVLCITIIGKQFFKIAGVSFLPFGLEIRTEHVF